MVVLSSLCFHRSAIAQNCTISGELFIQMQMQVLANLVAARRAGSLRLKISFPHPVNPYHP